MRYKYIKMNHLDDFVHVDDHSVFEITEKVDGANMSFMLDDDGNIVFRSRNRVITNWDDKMFRDAIGYVLNKVNMDKMSPNEIYFGECMVKHTIDYGTVNPFLAFGVFNKTTEHYMHDWRQIFKKIGINECVNDIGNVPAIDLNIDFIKSLANNKSAHGTIGVNMEGIVLKDYDTQTFLKYVTPKFKEKNKEVFGDNNQKMTTSEKIVYNYVTDARINKSIYGLIEDGEFDTFCMEMMTQLPKRVNRDMWEECSYEIISKYSKIDNKDIHKLTSKKCASRLQDFIIEWKLNNL